MGNSTATTVGATIGGIAGLALLAWPVAIWWEVRKCEKPRYALLRTIGQRRTWWGKTVPAAEVRGLGASRACLLLGARRVAA